MNFFQRHGFDSTAIQVSVSMGFAQVIVGVVAIPIAVDRAPSSWWFGVLVLLTGFILTLPVTYVTSWVISRTSASYIELDNVLACADKNGWMHIAQIKSLKTEKHVKTDMGTQTQLDTFRNGSFMIFQYVLILSIEYGMYVYGWGH